MTRISAGHLFLEAEGYAGETVDTLRAVTVVNLVLAVQPVIELEEERQVRFWLGTENHAIYHFIIYHFIIYHFTLFAYPHVVLYSEIEFYRRPECMFRIGIRCPVIR